MTLSIERFLRQRGRLAGNVQNRANICTSMRRLELYPFRLKDPVSGKWIKGSYVAERHVPGEWEIIGPPDIHEIDDDWTYFSPWANKAPFKEPPGNKPPAEKDPPPKQLRLMNRRRSARSANTSPQLDDIERFLVVLFLRRNVT